MMKKKLMGIFKRRDEQSSASKQSENALHSSIFLEGYSKGRTEGFDAGFAEGYNEGMTAGIRKTQEAALQVLNKGEQDGSK